MKFLIHVTLLIFSVSALASSWLYDDDKTSKIISACREKKLNKEELIKSMETEGEKALNIKCSKFNEKTKVMLCTSNNKKVASMLGGNGKISKHNYFFFDTKDECIKAHPNEGKIKFY